MLVARPIATLLFCCLVALPVHAADARLDQRTIANARTLVESASTDTGAFSIVESLTTEVGARMAGSEAYDRAVAWAQAKFTELGYDRVYLEPVSYDTWQRRRESAELLAPYPHHLALTTLGGSVGTGGKPLEAEVVEFATLDALQAVPDASLDGKIAFISNRMQRTRDGQGYGPAVKARGGASEAAKKGASALVIRSIGTDSDRLPHTGNMRYTEGVAKIPAAALSNPDADLLSNVLRRGKPVRMRLDLDVGMLGSDKVQYNVIGEIRGRGKPEEVVAIGGHLDSWDLGTGAIDDGAGVAITMAAGALIGRLPRAPRRTIRVIAFANEEQGIYGGKAYAEAHKGELDRHQLGAESDFGAGRVYAFRTGVDPAAQPVIEQIGELLQPLGIVHETGVGGPGPDFGPFVKLGLPWAQLAQDGTDYFDYHHTANDTLDKIDSRALDQQVAAYAVMAYIAAETPVDFGRSPPAPSSD